MAPFDKENKLVVESQEKVEPIKEPEVSLADIQAQQEAEYICQIQAAQRAMQESCFCGAGRGDFLIRP